MKKEREQTVNSWAVVSEGNLASQLLQNTIFRCGHSVTIKGQNRGNPQPHQDKEDPRHHKVTQCPLFQPKMGGLFLD